MNKHELKEVLDRHKQWLESYDELGERANLGEVDLSDANLTDVNLLGADLLYANLSNADLEYANFKSANLRCANLTDANLSNADLEYADLAHTDLTRADLRVANLRDADLRYANLRDADLRGADLKGADLTNSNLECADLTNADLRYADLRGADLRRVDLVGADLSGADLRSTNLTDADLVDADLTGIKVSTRTAGYYSVCPEEGSFIGFKKCRNDTIVKLLIPEDAERSSGTSRKCRADRAIVLEIINKYGRATEAAESIYDNDFIYKLGETVEVEDFDEDRWDECSTGIHFFITRREAKDYRY